MDKDDEKINPVNPKAIELLTRLGCVGIVDLITADLVATKWIISQQIVCLLNTILIENQC